MTNSPTKPSSSWHVSIFTLFPEMFPGPLGCSIAKSALDKGVWGYSTINPRDYALDSHKSVDDTPYGGGAGMVMRPDVLGRAIEAQETHYQRMVYLTPRGRPMTQDYIADLAKQETIAIICGRFEGVDERVIEEYGCEEVSIGDYVLSGGETAALVMMDACVRLLPGVLGNEKTLDEESFSRNEDNSGLLEYPLYTRPSEWKGRQVPDVLLSGNHEAIKRWRQTLSEEITRSRRNDLWTNYLKSGYVGDD